MIYPPKLSAGSRIRVVTAASPVKPEFIEPGLAWLRGRGWQAEWDPRGYRTDFYSAGTDEERAAELAGLWMIRPRRRSGSPAAATASGDSCRRSTGSCRRPPPPRRR